MNRPPVLLLPGWQNSGPDHWQSRWEALHGHARVEQHDWQRPLRGDWCMQLEESLLKLDRPAVLVAHSLGCQLVAAWAAHSRQTARVRAALLVAPADTEREALRSLLPSWSPLVLAPLPFASTVLASRSDPFCSWPRSQAFARAWGAKLLDAGDAGHLNADSGLGDWPWGHAQLLSLMND